MMVLAATSMNALNSYFLQVKSWYKIRGFSLKEKFIILFVLSHFFSRDFFIIYFNGGDKVGLVTLMVS